MRLGVIPRRRDAAEERVRRIELAEAAAAREGISPEDVQRRTEEQIPLKRLGTPEEFGAVVAFLASAGGNWFIVPVIQSPVVECPAFVRGPGLRRIA